MKKFPYSLIISKVIFNIGPDILRTIRRVTHRETKDCINVRLGRMPELKNQTAIVFHKESSRKLNFQIQKTTRLITVSETINKMQLLKKIEKAQLHYVKGNFDDRVAATLMSGFSNIWLSFVEIGEKYLNPLYSENETLKFYWIGGRKLFFYDENLSYFTSGKQSLPHLLSGISRRMIVTEVGFGYITIFMTNDCV